MKLFTIIATLFLFSSIQAQTILNNAIIKAKIETQRESSGENEGGGMMMAGGGDTEIKIVLKDSFSKVETKSPFFNNIVLMDRATNVSTILMEMQAEKTGYTQNAAERLEARRISDSTMKAQQENPEQSGPGRMVIRAGGPTEVKGIEYVEETKTVNGFACKKAIVTSKGSDGEETKTIVWYTDAYALPKGVTSGRGMMNFGDLKGLPIQYETSRTIKMGSNEITINSNYQVLEIKTDAKIEDKEFAIPKGYKVKTYAEWLKDNPGGMPGAVRMVIRG